MITHLLKQGLYSAWLFLFTPGCFGSDFTSFLQNSVKCSQFIRILVVVLDGLIEDLILIIL